MSANAASGSDSNLALYSGLAHAFATTRAPSAGGARFDSVHVALDLVQSQHSLLGQQRLHGADASGVVAEFLGVHAGMSVVAVVYFVAVIGAHVRASCQAVRSSHCS